MNTYTVDMKGEKFLVDLTHCSDIVDIVLDATYARVKLDTKLVNSIAYIMYRDRRGGPLDWLWSQEEFLDCFDWQMER